MKKTILLLAVLQLFLLSCAKEKTDICQSSLCTEYENIWEELFKSRNNITDDYFNEHITIIKTEVSSWNNGENFRVDYYNEIDWATIKNSDQFIIKKSVNAPPYPSLNLPIDIDLSKEEINLAVDNLALSSNITRINQFDNLEFNSKRKAIKAVEDIIPYNNAKLNRLYYKSDKLNSISNGHPFLEGGGTINKDENRCYSCEIDLITGDVTFNEGVCWVE